MNNLYWELLNKDVKEVSNIFKFCVYALWSEEEIVYIGQSTNVLRRIASHVKTKEFDSYSYFECNDRIEMNSIESQLITTLKPIYNRDVGNSYISMAKLRAKIRRLSKEYKYDPVYYVRNITQNLIESDIEVVKFDNISYIHIKDLLDAMKFLIE